MNKYQKALINIGELYVPEKYNEEWYFTVCVPLRDSNTYGDDYSLLQELVDKTVPKGVIVDDSEYEKYGENDYKCPSCNSWLRPDIFLEKHCCNCGQAIDWSEE